MKNTILLLVVATALLFSCGQGSRKQLNNHNEKGVYTQYAYADPAGKSLIIQNGFPRGEPYNDPSGKKYFKAIFWTRIINETDQPLELTIDFSAGRYEIPALPGKYYELLVPPDTMTIDKVPLYNYGMTGLQSFLDSNIHKPSSLKRTINPKESSGFFVVILGLFGEAHGTSRTGLSLKGQDLFYSISRYASTPTLPLIGEKEIPCGSINLKNLVLRE